MIIKKGSIELKGMIYYDKQGNYKIYKLQCGDLKRI